MSIANYQAVSDRRATLTEWYVTFKADLVNAGPALPGVTATISSSSREVQVVAGQGTLHFPPVPANGRVTSTDTFTLLVDRSIPFDWNKVEWSFNNPVANAGANQTAPLTGAVTLDGSASTNPSGAGTLSYRWTFQSIPSGSRAVLARADTPSPTFIVDAAGSYRCQLMVTNGSGADIAFVTVSTINSPPVASAGSDRTVAVGEAVTLNGSRSSDVDGDALTYSWSFVSIPPKSNSALLGAQTVLPTFVADAAGKYIVQLIVNDGKANSQPSTVTISTANTVPVANAGTGQTVTAGMFVQLNGAGSTDVDGDSLTYRWSFNSLPSGSTAVLSSPAAVNPTFTADKAGTYIVQLIVNDGKADSAAVTVTITTNAVQAPTARAGSDTTVHAGTTVQLGGSGTDPQGFPLTYSWSLPTRPPNSTASLSAANIPNPTFVADLPGVYAAQLVVSNGVLSSAPSTVQITTTNTAPVADPGSPQSAYTGDSVYLDGSRSSDADNDPIVAYSWSFTSKPESSLASLSGADTKTPTFVADVAGAYVVQLIVSDKFASSQARTVMISVGARTIRLGPDPMRLYNSPGTLNITLSPTPTNPVPVQLSAGTPGVVSFSPSPAIVPANSSGVNVTVTPISPGTSTITASAAGYYSSTGTVTVTKPTISIALNGGASAVGMTHKLGGTITLDAPAPPGGASVALTSSPAPDGEVTFESNPVRIPEGAATGAFTITGAQVGAATITAASTGYNSGRLGVQVVILGSVSLPAALTVGAGQSNALRVQLSAPAPPDGVTVLLASSDTNRVTVAPPSVTIKAGATTPDTLPNVSGVAQMTGEAIVTATAGGFYSDQQTVKVIAAITFKEQAVSVGPGGVKSFTILLSAPAPAGGLLVYLASSNESVATIPVPAALINAGEMSGEGQVAGVGVGTADITVSTNPSIPGNQYFSGAGAVLTVTVARPSLRITTDSLPAGVAGASYPAVTLSASGGSGLGYFWTVPVGSLPSGLNLNTSGVLSGALSSSATTSTFTVQVQDGVGNKDTKTFTITVTSPLSITTESLPAGVAGSSYPATSLTATGGSGSGYLWSLASGSLPAGLTMSTAGVISGDLPSSAATSSFMVQVQDSGGNTTAKQLSITVGTRLAITTSSVPAGTAGAGYPATTLEATGGTGSGYFWTLQNSSLPSGLILSNAGVISGTLSRTATTTTFTVQVKDSGNNTATKQFTLTVNAALSITTASLPNGMTGEAYPATTLTATGGSGSGYTWSVSTGSLPAGLTLSSAGTLSGTFSSSATTSTFTIQVKDSAGATSTAEFTITVYAGLSVTTTSLPSGTAGANYPAKLLTASGGSGIGYSWSVSSGSLPSGLTISAAGVLSGTLSASATTSTFTIQVQDSANNTATKQFTLTVNGAIQITTSSLPNGTGGAAYSATLAASGGSGTGYTWSVTAGSLPAGLNLSAAGVLSGTLAANATSSAFTVQVKDDALNVTTKPLSITVTLTITTPSVPAGDAGKSYSTLLAAVGGTGTGYTWSLLTGSLPSGLTISAGGILSGTLSSSAATSTFTIQVQDSANNTGSKQFTLTVNPALTITTASLPAGTTGAVYPSTTLAASGGSNAGYVWSVSAGSLPSGLTLSSGGLLSGTLATSATSATFTIQVQDSGGNSATKQFTISVETVLAIVTPSLPDAVAGASYPSTTLSAGGGTGAGYVWSISTGSLPASLALSDSGVVSGSVSESAVSSTFTVQVKDSGNHTATRQFTITVKPAVTITTSSLPAGTVGSVYPQTTLAATGGSGTGYTWSVCGGALPPGLTLSSSGVLSGLPSAPAANTAFTVCVRDSGGATASRQFNITINGVLSITTGSLPAGMATASYPSTTLAAAGGTGTGYSWSVSAGSLPSGLTLTSGGVLSGTLSASAATSTFTVQVQDSVGNTATKQYLLTVYPALTITTSALAAGIAGNAYPPTTLSATGGTGSGYSWSVASGSLPAGLNLSAAGVISGTLSPTATSTSVTIRVQDSAANVATQLFSITINPALSIGTASLPDGVAGTAYTPTTLSATGGSGSGYTWSVSAGSLPLGLTLSTAGALSGNLSSSATSSTFTIQVKDSGNNTSTKQFTITITAGLGVFTAVLPAGFAGTVYGPVTLTATGGSGAGYAWSVSGGSLPSGLTLSPGGSLSGTLATNAVTSTFTVQVKDSANNTATREFTLTVNPALSITTASLPTGTAESAYPSTTLAATGGTGNGYVWSVPSGSLPSGLTLSAAGVLSGTLASSAATSTFTVQVKDDGNHTATKQFTITVNPALQVTTAGLSPGTAGGVYPVTTLAATGGTGAGYTWTVSVGSLPGGLTLSSGGVLSGTLSATATTSTFTIQVQDSAGNTGRKQFTLTVTLVVTTNALPGATAGSAYAGATLTASGGTGAGYTWSLAAGSLPAGLTLSAAGVLSGSLLTSAATSTFTVQVQDSGGSIATKQLTIIVGALLAIDTVSLPTKMAGTVYPSTTLTASGGSGSGYTWSITLGSLPTGLTLSASGVISGTLGASATSSTFTVQVKDSADTTATKQFTITVIPGLAITTGSLPAILAGNVYPSTTLSASGGTGTGYTWSVSAGSLPAGLTLSSAGVISGTLGASATSSTFTVQVQDSGSNIATKQLTIQVYPVLAITTGTLPAGMAGTAYATTTLAATGGTGTGYTWSVSAGSLPSGLTLSSGGALSGTLGSVALSSTFTVQVQDSGSNTATKQFSITVYPVLSITTSSLPGGQAGTAYPATTLAATGGSGSGYTWSVSAGSLPSGLTLSAAGVLSGTLSAAAATATFTVQVQDGAANVATKQLTITVAQPITIGGGSLPHGVAGSAYPATTLSASGGSGVGYTWSVTAGALPTGLILSVGGVISGTLNTSAVTTTFTVQVKDSANNTAVREFTLTVDPALIVNPASLPVGVAGAAYAGATLSAAGGTGTGYTWSLSAGSLPTGLSLSSAGVISGTLGAAATSSTFTVQVQDSGSNTATRPFTLTVNPAVSITTASLPSGMAGASYSSTTLEASGGTATGYVWSVSSGSLPSGLTLSAGGVLSGTLSGSAATSTVTIRVEDSAGNSASRQYTITVLPALAITTVSLTGGTAGSSYPTVTLAASGGTNAGYTWSVAAGSLPTGLTLSPSGVISGSLAYIAVSSTFTVQVKDSGNNTATKQFTISVSPGLLTFTTGPTLANATINTPYSAAINALGGTLPYTWSASGMPAWLTLDTAGNVCGGVGIVCGKPSALGVVTFSVTVRDSGSPTYQSITQQFTFTVTSAGGLGGIVVPDVNVGVNLQAPLVISLVPPTSATTILTLTSGNAAAVRLGNASEAGGSPLNVTIPAGSSSIQVYVKALSQASPVAITVSADAGYTSGSGTVTITPSGFILSGPNGAGSSFTTFQGVTTGLTAAPYRLDANNLPVENQQIRGGLNVSAPIAVAPSVMGTMSAPAVAFSGGDQSATSLFTASYTASGDASITISPPLGSSFVTPATGATVNVSIQSSGFVVPSGITVGKNLQVPLTIGVTGPAAHDTIVTITSSDVNSLRFATSQTGAGQQSIQVVIRTGYAATPIFYARAYASGGSIQYTVSASSTYGTITTSMPLGPSGFVINTPTGPGADFSVTLGSPDPTLDLQTALFTTSGSVVEYQAVAPDANVTATLTSFTPSVGVVSAGSLQVLGGTYSRSFTFHAASVGSTNITATAAGYTGASVKATVTNVSVFLNPVGSVGYLLAAQGQINLSSPATTSVPVTVSVSSGPIKLAANKTDAGGSTITVNVLPGNTNATFWVFGTASSGTGTYTATAMGQVSAPDSVLLAPSGIAIYMGAPGNPSCFGTGSFGCSMTLVGGARTVYAVTYQLLADGSNSINGSQPLAGGVALSVPLNNSSPATGSAPATVTIAGGSSFGSFTFTPSATGSTILSVGTPSGWTPPSAFGFDISQLSITVQ